MANSIQTVLVIGYVWPEPNSSAAGQHILSLVRLFIGLGSKVHFASPAAIGEHIYDLRKEGVEQHEIMLNCCSFDAFIDGLQPEVVLFDRFMMEEQFGWRVAKVCSQALRVLDMEDMHSLRAARREVVRRGTEIDYATDLAKREVASIFRSDLSLVISEYELELLCSEYQVPEFLLQLCPFMLEPSNLGSPSFREREHFISIGNFRHAPNWDAVLQLKQTIWPLVRKKLPSAELHIYGAYPPPKAIQLHSDREGFLVKGWAPDAKDVMRKARVCLSPLRFGAGLKGKLAEAMMCGTPSVTTSVGAEGMRGDLAWPGAVIDDPESFAIEAVRLYSEEGHWRQKQDLIDPMLLGRFKKEDIEKRVRQRIENVLENLEVHREKNFIGSMLQHHTMKSTQYMSQWIEAKNSKNSNL